MLPLLVLLLTAAAAVSVVAQTAAPTTTSPTVPSGFVYYQSFNGRNCLPSQANVSKVTNMCVSITSLSILFGLRFECALRRMFTYRLDCTGPDITTFTILNDGVCTDINGGSIIVYCVSAPSPTTQSTPTTRFPTTQSLNATAPVPDDAASSSWSWISNPSVIWLGVGVAVGVLVLICYYVNLHRKEPKQSEQMSESYMEREGIMQDLRNSVDGY
jgi:hypothetical protein